ncbi:unnamed protein product [Caenorhabditis auriculariae]|uniref:Calmodulin-binding domain-containing protein n=1 Tax=Caenorhabditis auriculariae TaxID=2777116 RepID=A0A8S1GPJ7_9PELO|nr:unnamed protein product [Caenorhabditis auriculariae]
MRRKELVVICADMILYTEGKTFLSNCHQEKSLPHNVWQETGHVSADFLRLNGSRQQFKNLLSARKKLGSLPPAYTRIDYSRESLDSARGTPNHGPVITVEDTGSQLRINHVKSSLTQSLLESQHGSFDKIPPQGLGKLTNSKIADKTLCSYNFLYGVPIDSSAVKLVYRVRSERLNNRVRITDRSLFFALLGILLMFVESELTAQQIFGIDKSSLASIFLRSSVVLSTIALLYHIVLYHINDIVLELVDCGADDWRVVVTMERAVQFLVEFVFCAICPFPGTGTMQWSFITSSLHVPHDNMSPAFQTREVPVDVILSCAMLLRCYLFARFMVLHSKQFQDASTRTLAALNRIQVNFSFVLKTFLDQQPVLFLTMFTFVFWITMSWIFVQCERYGFPNKDANVIMYSNALWFIAITFMLNGYGDIVPQTHLGRIIAIFVGVVGAIISSILIAVISRNILLSQGQRNVNNFMHDSKLTREHKNAAARVLQYTWRIHKCLAGSENGDRKLRTYQRKFLRAIHAFRSIKNEMRVFGENNSASTQQVTRLVAEMHSSMQKLVNAQEEMRAQIDVLQRAVRNHYPPTAPYTRDSPKRQSSRGNSSPLAYENYHYCPNDQFDSN